MPIYEYVCTACGHRLEAMQKLNDPLLRECPTCKAAALRKLMSVAGIQVKNRSARSAAPACGAGACPACEID